MSRSLPFRPRPSRPARVVAYSTRRFPAPYVYDARIGGLVTKETAARLRAVREANYATWKRERTS